MPTYAHFLGHQPGLSTAEIAAVFSTLRIFPMTRHLSRTCLLVETDHEIDEQDVMAQLGGTIKIAKKIEDVETTPEAIATFLERCQPEGKIQFSLEPKQRGLNIKKILKERGRSVRYIEPKNTATILHNKLVEKQGDLMILNSDVFVTVAIQPMEEFSQRDYGRPGSDDISGMLPPKLARIMINLAQKDKTAKLLDPFCGSGTVLMEAAALGYTSLVGSDLSEKAVEDTKKNMGWLADASGSPSPEYNLLQSDVRSIDGAIPTNSIDVIVTEPYLGPPLKGNEKKEMLEHQAGELALLYREAFEVLYRMLKKNGVIVCVIPQFRHKHEWIVVDCINAIQKIGFTPTELLPGKTTLLYHRPKQYVGRAIWRFKKR